MWSRVLVEALQDGHGAAFIVLPHVPCPAIEIKYPVANHSIGLAIKEFWLACARNIGCVDRQTCEQAWNQCEYHQTELLTAARATTAVGRVDGCVVLDRELNIHGFGGKILLTQESLPPDRRRYVDYKSREPLSESEIGQFGTRHQSAFRLCQAMPGLIAFVVSQDGDLRVILSDQENVYYFEGASASAKGKEDW